MSITFNWSITKVQVSQREDKNNVVVNADWFVEAKDNINNITATASGVCNFDIGDSFTPYEQLTEQQVLNWCFEPQVITTLNVFDNTITTITKHIKTDGEAQVTGQIERKLAQKIAEPTLPWA
jgi:hypothetical protein